MLNSSRSRITVPKKVKILIGILAVLVFIAYAVMFIFQAVLKQDTGPSTPSSAQVSLNQTTSFDGQRINQNDQQALQQYCDDANTVATRLGNGNAIRDLCVLSRIANDYLPLMSEQEIAQMAENNPTCLTTGFDKDGFDCFTGFDKNGCGRNGLTVDGEECSPINTPSSNTAPRSQGELLLANKGQICELVAGCAEENDFDPMGFNQYGCDRQGKRKDGAACPYELVTKIYKDGVDQFGFSRDGFNEKGCDRQGLTREGIRCAYKDVTKTYNSEGRDHLGFDDQGFNRFGCDINGLDKEGKVCPVEHITRVVDPVTGLDQFGLDVNGFNDKNCNLDGYNRQGELCNTDDVPRIFGKDRLDQFGFRRDGRNIHNCDIAGTKPDGSLCKEDELTRVFNPNTGVDQFGFFPNGRNKFGCDALGKKEDGTICSAEERNVRVDPKTGLDPLGLTQDGYNNKGCNLQGFRRDGSRCAYKDITRVVNANGFDQFNLGADGFNPAGCNIEGMDRNGKQCDLKDIPRLFDNSGFDQFGIGKDGYNKFDCDINGRDREGQLCRSDLIPRIVDSKGVDQFGLDAGGFSIETGCNLQGFREDGSRCAYDAIPKITDAEGKNQFGMDPSGRNRFGCDINGRKPDGSVCADQEMITWYDDENMSVFHKDPEGKNRLGFNDLGFNEHNCDINGRKPSGELCESDKISRVYDPITQLDQFGLGKDGFNAAGCNLEGVNRQGKACDVADIPRIFDNNLNDQFGNAISSLPSSVWTSQAECLASMTPVLNAQNQHVRVYGQLAYRDAQGAIKNERCQLIKTAEGETLSLSDSGQIVTTNGRALHDSAVTSLGGRGNTQLTAGIASKHPVISPSGQTLAIDGKQAFALADGTIVDEQGAPFLDANGKPLKLNRNGEVVDSKGEKINSARLNIPNARLMKQEGASRASPMAMLLDQQGKASLVNGRHVYVDENGALRYADGTPVVDKNGNALFKNNKGEITNANGDVVNKELLPFDSINTVVTPDGKQLTIDGKTAFVTADGALVDENGIPFVDENGSPLKLNSKGEIVNAQGGKPDPRRLNSDNSGLYTADTLTDKKGEPLLVNGKNVYIDPNGALRYSDGSQVRDSNGNALFRNSKGEITNANGDVVNKELLPFDSINTVVTPDGKQLTIDGKTAFVTADGALVDENGIPFVDENGSPLKLNSKGEIVNAQGGKPDPRRLNSGNNGLYTADTLTDKKGEPLLVNGKNVYIDPNGALRYSDGSQVRDSNGNALFRNSKGDIVNAKGETGQAKDLPFNVSSLPGKPLSSNVLLGEQARAALDAMRTLTQEEKQALGLGDDGFNAKGCALNGLNREGKPCNIEDIPRRFNANGFDQFGIRADGYNAYGCDLDGKTRTGDDCEYSQIPKIFGTDGFNQLGGDVNGVNAAGVSLVTGKNSAGCDASGENCTPENVPVLVDGAGVDQFNQRINGRDRLNLINGFNEKGCNISGLNAAGERCDMRDIPRFDAGDGRDQFGLDANNRNRFGCDLQGFKENGERCRLDQVTRIFDGNNLDQFGLNQQMRNSKGCDINGLDVEGKICNIEDIPRLFNEKGMDQFHLDSDGFNSAGCNLSGVNRSGERCDDKDIPRIYDINNLDQFGLDNQGFNDKGCSLAGLRADGSRCDIKDTPRLFDPVTGRDQFGLDKAGFNANGCDLYGYNNEGALCDPNALTQLFDVHGISQFGVNKETGLNEQGCSLEGKQADGKLCPPKRQVRFVNKSGVDQFGLSDGFNEQGCNLDGLNREGKPCDFKHIPKIVDPQTGKDQLGLNGAGLNDKGCGLNGLNSAGQPCSPDDIPRIFGADNKDQFNLDQSGYNAAGCNLLGLKADGSRCSPDLAPAIFGKDGFSQLGFNRENRDDRGFDFKGFDNTGCDIDNRKPDGTPCEKFQNKDLSSKDGEYMTARKAALDAWLGQRVSAPKEIAEGTYSVENDPMYKKAPEPAAQPSSALIATTNQASATQASSNNQRGEEIVKIPMGMMFIIDVKTPVNSDYTQEVYATIIGSELDGATLKGRIDVPYLDDPVMPRDMFRYTFNEMVWQRKTFGIDAVTLSMDNDSGMVRADDVNYHRLQRYGGLLIASAVQALDATFLDNQAERDARRQADALENATLQSIQLGENTDALTRQNLKTATSHINELAKQQFTRRPTIKKGPGQHLVIFQQEVVDAGLPIVFDGIEH